MKAEHRKELGTNALADYLGTAIQQAKEGPSQRTLLIGGLVLVVAALVVTYLVVSNISKSNDSVRWEQLNALLQGTKPAATEDELKEVKKKYAGKGEEWQKQFYALDKFEKENPGTAQARVARFERARMLVEKPEDLYSSLLRDMAKPWFEEGRDLYERLIEESSDAPQLAQKAMLQAAKANECLYDFQRAKNLYARLLKEHPKSAFAPEAEKAVKRLEDVSDLNQLKDLLSK